MFIPAHLPSTMSMTVVASNTIVPTRNINALIEAATPLISSRLKKSTIQDMMIMTADKGFAIAVFTSAHLFSDMVREILCLTQTILRASMEYVCSAHLPDASTKGRIQTVPLYIRKFPYIRPTILLLLYLSFLLTFLPIRLMRIYTSKYLFPCPIILEYMCSKVFIPYIHTLHLSYLISYL